MEWWASPTLSAEHLVKVVRYGYITLCNSRFCLNSAPVTPTGNSRDFDFSSIKTLLVTPHCGNKQLVKPHLFDPVLLYYFYPHYFITKQTSIPTRHCGDDEKVKNRHIFPAIPGPTPRLSLLKKYDPSYFIVSVYLSHAYKLCMWTNITDSGFQNVLFE